MAHAGSHSVGVDLDSEAFARDLVARLGHQGLPGLEWNQHLSGTALVRLTDSVCAVHRTWTAC